MDSQKQPWKVWIFVLCLNIVAFGGAIYLKSNGIDLYSFRGASWFYKKNLTYHIIKNNMEKENESKWKKALDNILIYNLYVLIIGSIFLAISFLISVNGNPYLYSLFQKLWYPVFIPSLSLFFTAILFEGVHNRIKNHKKKQ